MNQAAYYSATMSYLKAVKAAGTTDSDKVMAEMKKTKINDFFAKNGAIRADGLMVARHVRDAGEDAGGVEVPVGLLQARQGDAGDEAFGPVVGLDLQARQAVAERSGRGGRVRGSRPCSPPHCSPRP